MNLVMGVIDRLIPRLEKLLGDEYKLQTEMKKQVRFLTRELESIQAFLCKVSDVPWYQLDEQVKIWAREAREVSYDMEDLLDTVHVRSKGPEPAKLSRLRRIMKKMGGLFSMAKTRRDISIAIQDIKNRLQEVADRRDRYRINDILVNHAATTWTIDPRLHAMYKEVEKLVGINKPRDDIISMLSSKDDVVVRQKKIVAIVGIGGLGKTTLAKTVYDKIGSHFDCMAFVPVGRNPNLSRLLMDILYELDEAEFRSIHTKNWDGKQLIKILREFLKKKRYFIVIDDLWEDKSWVEAIELALLENNCGSRVIITTRNFEVAEKIGDEIYRLPPLSDDNSKRLLYTRIFGNEEKWPDNEPDEISKKILKKCDGVPLAIITMASMLAGKSRERWTDVYTFVHFGRKDNKQVDNTMKILSFSYYDMPAYLRTCLLYLSVFPEDYMIDKDSLIWMWIAEGFIQSTPTGSRLFELGEQYFNDLVNRSMIQYIQTQGNGMVVGCHVHDMVLDLIRSISLENNSVTISDSIEGILSHPARNTRRLAVHKSTLMHKDNINMVDMRKVRSFVAIGCSLDNWIPNSSCKLLRVLNLEACIFLRSSHLVNLGDLLHLRYLGLKKCRYINHLPNEVSSLRFLQTLDLQWTGISTLDMSPLTQLLCLKYDCELTLAPNWIGNLTSLEELQVLKVWDGDQERGFLKELVSLRELRVLCCCFEDMNESMQRDLVQSLHKLHKLQILQLLDGPMVAADTTLWGEEDFVFPQYLQVLYLDVFYFSCLPPCIGAACLSNLTHLSLWVCHMDQKDLELLCRLPELCYIRLYTYSTVTISNISADNGYFRKLRFCSMPMSMIQLECKEEDSSISFCVWNGKDDVPFSSCEKNYHLAPYATMPNLEVLDIQIYIPVLKDSKLFEWSNIIGINYLPSLQKVQISIYCASDVELNEAEVALRKATEAHPNRPTLHLDCMPSISKYLSAASSYI